MPAPFWLSSDSTVIFALIFMTSTVVPQCQDSIKTCPLPSINIFFMAMEVRESRNKLLHGWAAFLNLIRLLSSKIPLSDPQRPSELNICLANLLHPSLLRDRLALNYHADPSQLAPSSPPLFVCLSVYMPERRPGYWSQLNEASPRSLQQIYVLTDSGWRRKLMSDKVLSQSDKVCAEQWGPTIDVNGTAW